MSQGFDSRPDNIKHIREVQSIIYIIIQGLLERARDHDSTKLESPEVEYFNTYTPMLKKLEYGSAEYEVSRQMLKVALDHHYEHSRHHPEHHENGIQDMSLIDVVEMLCDWLAACRRHDAGDIRKSIEVNQQRFGYGDELKNIFHNTIDLIGKESDFKTPREDSMKIIKCSRCKSEALFIKHETWNGKMLVGIYECPNKCLDHIEVLEKMLD